MLDFVLFLSGDFWDEFTSELAALSLEKRRILRHSRVSSIHSQEHSSEKEEKLLEKKGFCFEKTQKL